MKIGILGGAFDPVHQDHFNLAKFCISSQVVEEVWFTPSPSLRWDKSTVLPSSIRIELLQKLVQNEEGLKVCELEVEAGIYRGAYVFLSELQQNYPEHQFYLIMGADTYEGIPSWRDPRGVDADGNPLYNGESLLKEFPIILFERKGYDFPSFENHLEKTGQELVCLEVANHIGDASSTKVRELIQSGIDSLELVPHKIRKEVVEAFRIYNL